jgi:hypothetical protein
MAATDNQKKLATLLVSKSAKGELEWQPSVSEDSYQVSIKTNTIRLAEVPSRDPDSESPDYVISIINSEGREVDTFSDIDLNQTEQQGQKNWFRQLRGLYVTARRTALGSDKVLGDVLRDLGGGE